MVHQALLMWSTATVRRTVSRGERVSKVDQADSSSEGVSTSISSGSSTGSLSLQTSMNDESDSSYSQREDTSEGSFSQGSASLPIPPAQPNDPPKEEDVKQVASIEVTCQWFQEKLKEHPALKRCEGQLKKDGYDTKETIVFLEISDMEKMQIPPALRRVLEQVKKDAKVQPQT